uniref:Uncharacterized protein n=1 Tax=Trypanosoma vivax (strain Y486) TaxID=1055687 RepID=G0TTM6_TRYVY|nr:hypothetical protein, unlikely [Trypanosoma vivax Y486]
MPGIQEKYQKWAISLVGKHVPGATRRKKVSARVCVIIHPVALNRPSYILAPPQSVLSLPTAVECKLRGRGDGSVVKLAHNNMNTISTIYRRPYIEATREYCRFSHLKNNPQSKYTRTTWLRKIRTLERGVPTIVYSCYFLSASAPLHLR